MFSGTTIGQLPAPGATATITRDLAVTPATLHLTGTISAPDGTPLRNASVSVTGTSLSSVTAVGRAQTDTNGVYSLYLVLKQGATSGSLTYEVQYDTVTVRRQVNFSAVPAELREIAQDITIAERRLRFYGQIGSALVAGQLVGANRVDVASPVLGPLCTWTAYYNTQTSYDCTAQITTTQALSVTYTVSGDWGSATIAGAATPVPAIGATASVPRNLTVAPATLRLHGAVVDGGGKALSGATIAVEGDTLSANNLARSGTTDAGGAYSFYVILRQGVIEGSFNYRVSYNGISANGSGTFSAATGELRDVVKSFSIGERRLNFSGILRNALAEGQPLRSNQVEISAASAGTLCTWNASPYDYYRTSYACNVTLASTGSLSLTYTVRGDWGSAVLSDTSAISLPPAGGQLNISRDLSVAPTTLRLTGTVRDGAGAALRSASIQVYSSAFLEGLGAVSTNTNGTYTIYAPLREGVGEGTIRYEIRYNSTTVEEQAAFSAAAGQQTTVARDVVFNARHVQLDGRVINKLVPWTLYVPGNRLLISTPTLGTLCDINLRGGASYSCTSQITTTNALSVTYDISGDWGSATLDGVIGAGGLGSAMQVTRDLAVAPTTLHLSGFVRQPDGAPAVNARLVVTGAGLLQGTPLYTAADGGYDAYLLLRQDSTGDALSYTVYYRELTHKEQISFSAVANALTEIPHDIDLFFVPYST